MNNVNILINDIKDIFLSYLDSMVGIRIVKSGGLIWVKDVCEDRNTITISSTILINEESINCILHIYNFICQNELDITYFRVDRSENEDPETLVSSLRNINNISSEKIKESMSKSMGHRIYVGLDVVY